MKNKPGDLWKLSKKVSSLQTPISLSHDALFSKSKLFAKRSIDSRQLGQDTECQLWAAAALELLAKSQLASIHPTLVAESENPNSLLEACGISTGTKVKTITAAVAYKRLNHTVPNFSTPVMNCCIKLADRRNAELHSGEAACASMPMSEWEGDFWNAADLILKSMDMNLQEWLGADAKAPVKLLKAYKNAESEAAKQRVIHHTAEFKNSKVGKFGRDKREAFLISTKNQPIDLKAFHYFYAQYWRHPCPSCNGWGALAGDLIWEDRAEDQTGADYGYEMIERAYLPTEFHCSTCGLSLVGDLAVGAVGISEPYIETEEVEIMYEPEYGND